MSTPTAQTFAEWMSLKLGLSMTDTTALLSVADALQARCNDKPFWLGLHAWACHKQRTAMLDAVGKTDREAWMALGRGEVWAKLSDALASIPAESEAMEKAYVALINRAQPKEKPEF